jgi:hypothetical protein
MNRRNCFDGNDNVTGFSTSDDQPPAGKFEYFIAALPVQGIFA